MKRPVASSSQWIFLLTIASLFGAAVLRTLVVYWGSPGALQILGLLSVWLILLILETRISTNKLLDRSLRGHFLIYLVIQTSLAFILLARPDLTDYLAILFAILSMQVMQRLNSRVGAFWIGLFALLILLALTGPYGLSQAIALTLVFTALNVFLAAYSLTTRSAQAARLRNQTLAQELQSKNLQVQNYSHQLEKMVVEKEHHRLARELHDSVTQTVFSMTLTTQSALILLDRYPSQEVDKPSVSRQLDRLYRLAQSALSELRELITELQPERTLHGDLVTTLHQHLASQHLVGSLSVSMEVEGEIPLSPEEERGVFRIIQEALNNIIKHSGVTQATIQLHLKDPIWIEVADAGEGFDVQKALTSDFSSEKVGLRSMQERADEIGWKLSITSSLNSGTRIRIRKFYDVNTEKKRQI